MKKNILRLRVLIPAAVVCVLTLAMAMASGSNITSSDPLVSLSYLNGTFKTQTLSEAQTAISTQSTQLETKLTQRINGVKTAAATQPAATATHTTVNIAANSSYVVPSGSEFLFLSGEAVAVAAGLSDLTDGTIVGAQGALQVNHLYAATTSVNIKATSSARILIRK